MTVWGATAKNLKAGLDVAMSPGSLAATTYTVTVNVGCYAQSQAWGFSDGQVGELRGSIYSDLAYTMSSPNGSTTTVFIGSRSIDVATSTTSTTTLSFALTITGIYITSGANPTVSVSITVPTRPPGVWVRIAGSWSPAVATYLRSGSAWATITRWWGLISGSWR